VNGPCSGTLALVCRAPLRAAVVAGIVVIWVAGLEVGSIQLALLYLAPAALLISLLVCGRYPGAPVLERRLRRARRVPCRGPRLLDRPRRAVRALGRGGLLLASGLAGRAPPGVAGAAR